MTALVRLPRRPGFASRAAREIRAVIERAFPPSPMVPEPLTRLAEAADAARGRTRTVSPPTPPASPGPDA